MTGRSVRWRACWALAQLTGVLFSTLVWLVLLAAAPWSVAGALVAGTVFVVAFRTRPVLWLAFGARSAVAGDREAVLRAIVPIATLRGRRQPAVLVATGRRSLGWSVLAPGPRTLLVSESLMARIRTAAVSDVEVSVLVARAFGQVPVLGSRVVLAVEIYCLPWAVVEAVSARAASWLSRLPLVSLSWRLRPLVFGLGLMDAVQHGRWEAAVPLLMLAVLTYTTGPLRRRWQRRLVELGEWRVAAERLDAEPGAAEHRRVAGRGERLEMFR